MDKVKVYIGHMYGKGLFHVYDDNIENGLSFFIDKNLGELVKNVTKSARAVKNAPRIEFVPKICRWETFIHE